MITVRTELTQWSTIKLGSVEASSWKQMEAEFGGFQGVTTPYFSSTFRILGCAHPSHQPKGFQGVPTPYFL